MPIKKYIIFHEIKGYLAVSKDQNKKMLVWTKNRHEAKEFDTFLEADANILPHEGERVIKIQ